MVISPPILLGTIGMDDTLLLMVLALVLLGPRRLPQVGRQIGKLMYEFRKASNDFKYQLEEELRNAEEADRRKREEAERQRALADTQSAVAQAQSAAEQALQAAAQAQSAAQAALGAAADSGTPVAALPAPEPGVAETVDPDDPDMIYNYGYEDAEDFASEEAASESPSAAHPTTEPMPETAAETGFEPAPESASESAPAAAVAGLRVQPPSTGEQVPAERPGRAGAGEITAEPAAAAPEEIPVKKEVAAEEDRAATESATHHG